MLWRRLLFPFSRHWRQKQFACCAFVCARFQCDLNGFRAHANTPKSKASVLIGLATKSATNFDCLVAIAVSRGPKVSNCRRGSSLTHVGLFGQSVRNGVKRLMVRSAVRLCVTNFWPRPRAFGSAQPLMRTSGAHLLTAVASSRDVTASHPFDCCFEQQRRCGVTPLLTAVASSRDIAAQRRLRGVHRTSSVHSTPASGVEYIAPAASHVTRAPVVEYLIPAPAACYVALVVEYTAQAVSHVTPTPVDDCMTPVASAIVAPAPVDESASRLRQLRRLRQHLSSCTTRLRQ